MKNSLLRLIEKYLPTTLAFYRATKNRKRFKDLFFELQSAVRNELYGREVVKVLTGPFASMKYIDEIVWGSITSRWLGCYEWELQGTIEEIINHRYTQIIDIGCGEGYYSTGLALRCKEAKVFAFDADPYSRRQAEKMAVLNGVGSRIAIGSWFKPGKVPHNKSGDTLLICDIEGFERQLLNPVKWPDLSRIDMLVELHNSGNADPLTTQQLLTDRFKASHLILEIKAEGREAWKNNFREHFSKKNLEEALLSNAVNEYRNEWQSWFWMKANGTNLVN